MTQFIALLGVQVIYFLQIVCLTLGKVNTTTYIFETMKARKKAFPLFPDTGNPIEARIIRFYLKVCNNTVVIAIKGKFRLEFNGNRVNYKGKLLLYSLR